MKHNKCVQMVHQRDNTLNALEKMRNPLQFRVTIEGVSGQPVVVELGASNDLEGFIDHMKGHVEKSKEYWLLEAQVELKELKSLLEG